MAETVTDRPLDLPGPRVPAAERGRLDLADRVVEKVAARAALECAGVVSTGGDRSAVGDVVQRVVRTDLPRADAQVGSGATRVDVRVASRWPAALPEVTAAVHDRVAARVSELTGLRVDAVDVHVTTVAGPRSGALDTPDVAGTPLQGAATPVRSTRVVVLGCLLALVLVALGVLAVQSALVAAGWLSSGSWLESVVDGIGVLTPATWFVPVGVLVALVGLWLVVGALRPGRRRSLSVASGSGLWMSRRDVARFASAAAENVTGVLSASTSVGRRSVAVSVQGTGPDVTSEVEAAVRERLSVLDPAPRVTVRQKGSPS